MQLRWVWCGSLFALSSLRRGKRCHACRCRGPLPNINGRAAEQRRERVQCCRPIPICTVMGYLTHNLGAGNNDQQDKKIEYDELEALSSAWVGTNQLCYGVLAPYLLSCCGEQATTAADRETFSRYSPGFTIRSTLPRRPLCWQHSLADRCGSSSSDVQTDTSQERF